MKMKTTQNISGKCSRNFPAKKPREMVRHSFSFMSIPKAIETIWGLIEHKLSKIISKIEHFDLKTNNSIERKK